MTLLFAPGDDLVFQLESGFGLLRILAVEEQGEQRIWHLLAYEEFFPDVEAAEQALTSADWSTYTRASHLALTDRALEKTPAARLGNRPVTTAETTAHQAWIERGGKASDRSVLLTLGLR